MAQTITSLANLSWASDVMSKRTDISLELYKKGLEHLNSKPMNINQFDVLFNQFDRKSNFTLNQLLYLFNYFKFNIQENDNTLLLKSLNKLTTANGFGSSAPLLEEGYDLFDPRVTNVNKIMTLNGKYKNAPSGDNVVHKGVLIVNVGKNNIITLTFLDTLSQEWIVSVEVKSDNTRSGTWKKTASINRDNYWWAFQTFQYGFYDARTQIGLVSTKNSINSDSRKVLTDADIIKLPLGAKFICNFKEYNNKPNGLTDYAYISRDFTYDKTGNSIGDGVFRLFTPFDSGIFKEWVGYRQYGANNNNIIWKRKIFPEFENIFIANNTFREKYSAINARKPAIKLESNYSITSLSQKILQSAYIEFSPYNNNSYAKLYYEFFDDNNNYFVVNVNNAKTYFNHDGDVILENGSYLRLADMRFIENREYVPSDSVLKICSELKPFYYNTANSNNKNKLVGIDASDVKNYWGIGWKEYIPAKENKNSTFGKVLAVDYDAITCLTLAGLNGIVNETGVGTCMGISTTSGAKSSFFAPEKYNDIYTMKNGLVKTVSWEKYIGLKPPKYNNKDAGQIFNLGVASGGGSLIYTIHKSNFNPQQAYIGFIKQMSKSDLETNNPDVEQITWKQIAWQSETNTFYRKQNFENGIQVGCTSIGDDGASESWIDVGKHKKLKGNSSISFWESSTTQTSTIVVPAEGGDLHFHTKRNHVFHQPIVIHPDVGTELGGRTQIVAVDWGEGKTGTSSIGGVIQSRLADGLGRMNMYFVDRVGAYSEGCLSVCPFDEQKWKTWSFRNDGNAYAWEGSWINSSDQRLKENFKKIVSPLEKIKNITAYSYNRVGHDIEQREVGVLAQDVQKVLPEAVTNSVETITIKNGSEISNPLGVNYSSLTALSIECIKELMLKIEKLEKEIEELKNAK